MEVLALLRHSDRVTVACQAQLVNVIAPIMTEPGGRAWRQSIFYPFALTSRMANGTVLRIELSSPTLETQRYGTVPVVDAVAAHDEVSGEVTIFVVNRDLSEPVDLVVPLTAFSQLDVLETWTIGGADPYESNTADEPDRVVARPLASAKVSQARLTASLPPVSWSAVRLGPAASYRSQ